MWILYHAFLISHAFLYSKNISRGWWYFLQLVWTHYLEIKKKHREIMIFDASPRTTVNSLCTWTATSPVAQPQSASCQLLPSLALQFLPFFTATDTYGRMCDVYSHCTSALLCCHEGTEHQEPRVSATPHTKRYSGSQSESKTRRPQKKTRGQLADRSLWPKCQQTSSEGRTILLLYLHS